MTPLDTSTNTAPVCTGERGKRDLRAVEKVRAIFASMSRYIGAKTIYASNNPNLGNFSRAFHETFRAYFEVEKELLLTIEQYRIKWRDEVVYENEQKAQSIAFLFYKDGVGEVIFQSPVKGEELEQFADLLMREIHSPSAHLDIVGRLWQSDFTNIHYRVFDESADGAAGDRGNGTGCDTREEPLRVNDHPGLAGSDRAAPGGSARLESSVESLGAYFNGIVEHLHPLAASHKREAHLQELFESYFVPGPEELQSWRAYCAASNSRNKVLSLLDVMLEFTRMHSPPAIVRDIRDIIERVVRYVVEDAHIPSLIALLEAQRRIAASDAIAVDFQDLPDRIQGELTNNAFLLSLGKLAHKSNADALDVLRYFRLVGRDAVPGICELLANSKDSSTHRHACDALIDVAGNDVSAIVGDLNLDNPYEAKDAIYLLRRFMTGDIPPIIKTLLTSPDIQVREQAIEYLSLAGGEEAARLLCRCLEDGDPRVRTKALAAVEEFRHPLIVEKVSSMCFAEDAATKEADELERLFRAVGKLAGEAALQQLRQMAKTRKWFPIGKARAKQNKLLAITALRHIPGPAASSILTELAEEGDGLVRTKAQHALKQRQGRAGARTGEGSADGPERAEP